MASTSSSLFMHAEYFPWYLTKMIFLIFFHFSQTVTTNIIPSTHWKTFILLTLLFFSFLAKSGTFLCTSILLLFSVTYGYSQGSSHKVCRFFTIQKKFQLKLKQQQVKQTNSTLSVVLIKLTLKFHSFWIRFPGFYLALQSWFLFLTHFVNFLPFFLPHFATLPNVTCFQCLIAPAYR